MTTEIFISILGATTGILLTSLTHGLQIETV
jgi:hypothetical protein